MESTFRIPISVLSPQVLPQCIHLLCCSLLVSGEVMYSDTSLIYLARIKSSPVEQSVLIVLIYFSFALNVTLPSTKESLSL